MMVHALKYAADGFAVFPIYEPIASGVCSCSIGAADFMPDGKPHSKGKHPRTMHGVDDATIDAETIKGWWTKWPNASIGIATGKKSGVSVVDLDGPEGLQSGRSLRLLSTITSLTGAGKQLFYADPEGKVISRVKKLAPGIDTRGNGGYVVAPPSLHPNGKRYVWESLPLCRSQMPSLPSILQESSPSPTALAPRKPEGWMTEAFEKLKNGHVTGNTLVSVLGAFKARNLSENDTYTILKPHALLDGKPFEGLRAKIAEIWQRYPPLERTGLERSEDIEAFLTNVKEVEWICKPYVAKKAIGLVAGLPETLKTWLCIDLAVESARGSGLWAGLFPVTDCRVLFIDQERARDETQNRFKSVLAAKGLTRSDLKGRLSIKCGTTIRINLDSSYQAFRSELLDLRPDLIIVDSLKTFHTLAENDNEMQKVFERLKELRNEIGCAFLLLHHENKNAYPNGVPQGEPNMGTISGSTAITAAPEFGLIVRKVEEYTSMVWHVKSTQGKKAKPFYASVVDVDNGIVVRGLND